MLCILLSMSLASCKHGKDVKEVAGTWTATGLEAVMRYEGEIEYKGEATYTITFDEDAFIVKSKLKGTGEFKGADITVTGKGTVKLEDGVMKFKLKKLEGDEIDETFTYKYEYVDKTSFTLTAKDDDMQLLFYLFEGDSKLTFKKD